MCGGDGARGGGVQGGVAQGEDGQGGRGLSPSSGSRSPLARAESDVDGPDEQLSPLSAPPPSTPLSDHDLPCGSYYMVSHGKLVIEEKLLQKQGLFGFDVVA